DRDRAPLDDVPRELAGESDRHTRATGAVELDAGHVAPPVYVSLHQMSSEARDERDGALEVHRIPRSEVPETRPLERLLRQIEPQRRVGALHHREADAVHRQGCPNVAVANDRTGVDDQTAGPRRRDAAT